MADLIRFNAYSREFLDVDVTFTVDYDILTPERAALINGFWIDAEARLVSRNSDAREAVCHLAAQFFIERVIEARKDVDGMNAELYESEGWGDYSDNGIRLVAFSGGPPEIDFDDVVVEEIA